MKKLYIIFALLTLSLLGVGCFDDKGNYKYSDVNHLTIKLNNGALSVSVTLGEAIEVKPTLTFANGTGNTERLLYKWSLDGYTQPDWNTLNFSWVPDYLMDSKPLLLEITDPVTGLVASEYLKCYVKSRYQDRGIMVLAEKNSITQMSFIKFPSSGLQSRLGSMPFEYVEYLNAYNVDNDEDLPAEPIMLHQHFCADASTIGQILAVTRNGAVDINGQDFKRELELAGEFDGGAYPANLDYVADAMLMGRVDVVADSEGHLYSRIKDTKDLFHSGFFLPNRLEVDDEELTGCRLITAPFQYLDACMVHDTNKKRLLLIGDTGTNTGSGTDPNQDAGAVYKLANPNTMPEGFLSITDMSGANIIWIGYTHANDMSDMGYIMVFERDGKIFCQYFKIAKVYGQFSYSIEDATVSEITGLPGIPTCVYGANYKEYNPLLFCAIGKDLYVYDQDNPLLPAEKHSTFRANVIDMDGDVYAGWWLCAALDDGSVLLLNAVKCKDDPKNRYIYYDSMREIQYLPPYKEDDGTMTERPENEGTPVTFGTIKDVKLKIAISSGWQVD